jgi:hypothetical protein
VRRLPRLAAGAAAAVLAVATLDAIGVKVEADRSFDFTAARTWAWHPEGPGDVMMARTATDDPAAARQQAEPIIVGAVTEEMRRRGRQLTTVAPDLLVMYYLLLTLNVSAQTMGQFVPAVPEWGLPPFTASTQSLEIMNRGSLVIDVSAAGKVVWRGVAQAGISLDADRERREALLREAARELVRRLPKAS